MNKFMIVVLIISGIVWYFMPQIMAKKKEVKLRSFTKAQEEFWRAAKKVPKKKMQKLFKQAEQGILDGKIDTLEYEELASLLKSITMDQEVNKGEIKGLENNMKHWLTKQDKMIRK